MARTELVGARETALERGKQLDTRQYRRVSITHRPARGSSLERYSISCHHFPWLALSLAVVVGGLSFSALLALWANIGLFIVSLTLWLMLACYTVHWFVKVVSRFEFRPRHRVLVFAEGFALPKSNCFTLAI